MKILVTGGAGFIGQNLVHELAKEKENEIVIVDNFVCFHGLYKMHLIDFPENVRVVHCDIRIAGDFNRVGEGKLDKVYHLAANFANEMSVKYPSIDMETNVAGTLNTIQFAISTGVKKFVYLGTSSSYGASNEPMHENMEMKPSTPYALSKLMGEEYVKIHRGRFEYAILRLFNVIGKYDYPGTYRNAIPNMVYRGITEKNIIVYGSKATRDFTQVENVVYILMNDNRIVNDTVNIGSGKEINIVDLAEKIAKVIGTEVNVEIGKRRQWDTIPNRVANNLKMRDLYPELQEMKFDTALKLTIDWLIKQI